MNEQKKILILVPSTTAKGGISNYYEILKDKFSNNVFYFTRGARKWPVRKNQIVETVRAIQDFWQFFIKIRSGTYAIVQTNTSIGNLGLIRDGLFLFLARIYSLKTIVFFRGLHIDFQNTIEKRYLRIFRYFFLNSDCYIVLSKQFERKLRDWGYKNPIHLETTAVDENMLTDISEEYIVKKYQNINSHLNILFLARIEKAKGIYEAIDSFIMLKSKYTNLTMTIAGDGFELENVIRKVNKSGISDIKFVGFVKNENKTNVFRDAHIYLFTSHTEGMPTSVLEAFSFGIPVVTSAVGGIVDFFENGINGYITELKEPEIYRNLIENLIKNPNLMNKIALNNYRYAQQQFLSLKVAKRLENIFSDLMNE